MDLKNKVAVVTGGANGIGRAVVEAFLKSGARVASIDLDWEAAQGLASRFNRNQLLFMEGGVAVESTLQQFAQAIRAQWGKVDYLINNACISQGGITRVNAISPGWIDTSNDPGSLSRADHLQHPVKRVGHPSDIVKMVLFLYSEASSFMTGEHLTIDGGMSKQMIYHGEYGWSYQPPTEGTDPR